MTKNVANLTPEDVLSPFMECLTDNQIHSLDEVRQYCIKALGLSKEIGQEQLPCGLNKVESYVGEARTWLKKEGWVNSPSRAKFYITSKGQRAIVNATANGIKITWAYLRQFESF